MEHFRLLEKNVNVQAYQGGVSEKRRHIRGENQDLSVTSRKQSRSCEAGRGEAKKQSVRLFPGSPWWRAAEDDRVKMRLPRKGLLQNVE